MLYVDVFGGRSPIEGAVLGALLHGEHLSEEGAVTIGTLAHHFGLGSWGPTSCEDNLRVLRVAVEELKDAGLVAVGSVGDGDPSGCEVWLTPPSTSWLTPEEWSVIEALSGAGQPVNLNYLVREMSGLKPGAEGYEEAWEKMAGLVRGLAEKPMPIQVCCTENSGTGFDVWLEEAS